MCELAAQPIVNPLPRTVAAHHVVLSSARIASQIDDRQVPRGEDLFLLSAALVESARCRDAHAIELGLESAASLLDNLPPTASWDACRGYLGSTVELAWLLLRRGTCNP